MLASIKTIRGIIHDISVTRLGSGSIRAMSESALSLFHLSVVLSGEETSVEEESTAFVRPELALLNSSLTPRTHNACMQAGKNESLKRILTAILQPFADAWMNWNVKEQIAASRMQKDALFEFSKKIYGEIIKLFGSRTRKYFIDAYGYLKIGVKGAWL